MYGISVARLVTTILTRRNAQRTEMLPACLDASHTPTRAGRVDSMEPSTSCSQADERRKSRPGAAQESSLLSGPTCGH